jgi:hypothetical protein
MTKINFFVIYQTTFQLPFSDFRDEGFYDSEGFDFDDDDSEGFDFDDDDDNDDVDEYSFDDGKKNEAGSSAENSDRKVPLRPPPP